jgi:uncharacterized protein YdhG (YjbR/CyaY superfamily)
MPTKTVPADAVDRYIAGFPPETQKALQQMRRTIRKAAPDATEVISYQMPAYKYLGMLVYFAGYEKHIGFYPMPSAIQQFKKELAVFKNAKGSVQFPLGQPLPLDLVSRMVQFRVQENQAKAGATVRQPKEDFLSLLPAPARRALENKGITTLKKLASFSAADILTLHGMGPSSLPKLREALKAAGLAFKQ